MGYNVIIKNENKSKKALKNNQKVLNKKCIKKVRPPVVTIMGHVNHGKTTLLDCIRSSNVADHEFGGITQHINAYHVKTKKGVITFLDTPGHDAFTSMRSRGVKITDIIVLVIAGDDGVKPQTIEVIRYAQESNVPILVAISKIDKPESNPEKIKKELMKYNILPEEWGGQNIFVNISSKNRESINELLDSILLQSELLELTAIYSGLASGMIIESYLDKNKGVISTILVQQGILKKGDVILCGLEYGKIRSIQDSFGCELQSSEPSIPVKILGFSGVPISGDFFTIIEHEKKAREISISRKKKFREMKLYKTKKITIDNIFDNLNNKNNVFLNIILKTDVQGSLEAILYSLNNIQHKNVSIKIVYANVGNITETDVSLALTSKSIIIAFNVQVNISIKYMIINKNIDIRYYSVIYNLIDDLKSIVLGLLSPQYNKKIMGIAEVRNIFKSSKSVIAGCMVTKGIIKRYNHIHLIRNNLIIHEGELESLRHFKQDIKEVNTGKECGLSIKNCNDMNIGDIIKSFEVIKLKI
ncbi:translation initiation factor IF-2 [Buchnera aphidicola (Stegophylla sp.)]|uniref:Translation initiation factor IF-2 n=2 Tax=Buchnera aphidicola TaxID=9 RepID=A0A4D6YBC3_9GAMM|nr:translation initiation factor IF-2 [Buchnera aphidicola (Stegophylla sp.)]